MVIRPHDVITAQTNAKSLTKVKFLVQFEAIQPATSKNYEKL
jgi:hypothetical protein